MTDDIPSEEAGLRRGLNTLRVKLTKQMKKPWSSTDEKLATKLISSWKRDWTILEEAVDDRMRKITEKTEYEAALDEWTDYSLKVERELEEHKETLVNWKNDRNPQEKTGHAWKDQELLQTALFCSLAVYKPKPFSFLKTSRYRHFIEEVCVVGEYRTKDQHPQRCLMAVSSASKEKKERCLFVAVKGSATIDALLDSMKIEKVSHERFSGKFHRGFLSRAVSFNMDDIKKVADIYKVDRIVTCGHSLGGAVSAILYLLLQKTTGVPIKKEKIYNFTFGAPLIGDSDLQESVASCGFDKNMFNFVVNKDIIPPWLFGSYTLQTLVESIKTNKSKWIESIQKAGKGKPGYYLVFFGLQLLVNLKKNSASSDLAKCLIDKNTWGDKKKLLLEMVNNVEDVFKWTAVDDFEPIGRFVFLSEVLHILSNKREIHKVLKKSFKTSVREEIKNIGNNHSMPIYYGHLSRLTTFVGSSCKIVKIQKTPLAGCFGINFTFQSQSEFCCANNNCKAQKYLHEDPRAKLILCKDCRDDKMKEEFVYHKECIADCQRKAHDILALSGGAEFDPEMMMGILENCYDVKTMANTEDSSIESSYRGECLRKDIFSHQLSIKIIIFII